MRKGYAPRAGEMCRRIRWAPELPEHHERGGPEQNRDRGRDRQVLPERRGLIQFSQLQRHEFPLSLPALNRPVVCFRFGHAALR